MTSMGYYPDRKRMPMRSDYESEEIKQDHKRRQESE